MSDAKFPHVSPPDFLEAIRRNQPRLYPFSAILPVAASAGVVTQQLFTPHILLTAAGAGATSNAYIHAAEDLWNAGDAWENAGVSAHFGKYRSVLEVQVKRFGWTGVGPNKMYGLILGTPGAGFPWVGGATGPFVALLFNVSSNAWQVWTCLGDGIALGTSTTLPFAAPAIGDCNRLTLDFEPGSAVRAYVDGALGVELTANIPNFDTIAGGPQFDGAGIIVCAGAGTGNTGSALFAALNCLLIGAP